MIEPSLARRPTDEYQKEIPVIVILTEYEGSHYLYQMENELRLSTSTSTGLLANQNMYNSNQLNFTDVVARLISPYLRPDSNLGALSSAVFYHYYTEYMQRHNGITNKQIFDQEAFTITANVSLLRIDKLAALFGQIFKSQYSLQSLRSKLLGSPRERIAANRSVKIAPRRSSLFGVHLFGANFMCIFDFKFLILNF